jgi:DNA-binding protein YbaB
MTQPSDANPPAAPPSPPDPVALAYQRAQEALLRVEEMGNRLREVIARADSADHKVRMAVNPAGQITELRLDPECMEMSPEDLARVIQSVHQQALTRAQQQTEATFGETTGLPSDLARQAQSGKLDVRGMLQSMGLAELLGPAEKLAGRKII